MTETKELYIVDTDNPTGYRKLTRMEFYHIVKPIIRQQILRLQTTSRIPGNTRDKRRFVEFKNADRFLEDMKRDAKNAY